MGLDIYLEWDGQTEDEEKAQFTGFVNAGNAGYLRSSYNSGGFNSWADRHIQGKDLYYIFQPIESESFTPDWNEAEKRRAEALELALKAQDDPVVISCSSHQKVKSSKEALAIFKNEASKKHGFNSFSSANGTFYLGNEQPEVLAVIQGVNSINLPCTYLICKSQDKHKYYIDFLSKEVYEFIKLGKEKNGSVVWSG